MNICCVGGGRVGLISASVQEWDMCGCGFLYRNIKDVGHMFTSLGVGVAGYTSKVLNYTSKVQRRARPPVHTSWGV